MKNFLYHGTRELIAWASVHPVKSHAFDFSFTCLAILCLNADTPLSWAILLAYVFAWGLILRRDLRILRQNLHIHAI